MYVYIVYTSLSENKSVSARPINRLQVQVFARGASTNAGVAKPRVLSQPVNSAAFVRHLARTARTSSRDRTDEEKRMRGARLIERQP